MTFFLLAQTWQGYNDPDPTRLSEWAFTFFLIVVGMALLIKVWEWIQKS